MDYLKILVEDIHSVVLATVDNEGKPSTRVVNLMHQDGENIYFLTSNKKQMYRQLIENPNVALTGMTEGEDTLSKKTITIQGKVKCIGRDKLDILLEKSPYMYDIYPTEEARKVLEVFTFESAIGEVYDLTVLPPRVTTFKLGSIKK